MESFKMDYSFLVTRLSRNTVSMIVLLGWLVVAACGNETNGQEQSSQATVDEEPVPEAVPEAVSEAVSEAVPEEYPAVDDILPEPMATLWQPWHGDLDGMIERRVIRVLVPFGGYQYYYVRGRPRGAIVELLQKMEQHLNKELERRHIKVYVAPIPVSRDQLIPFLLDGHGDLAAADLTVTAARSKQLQFSRPLLKSINEVIVTGPSSPPLEALSDLSGQEIVVRASSS